MKWAAFQGTSQHLRLLLLHGGNPNLRYPTAVVRPTPLHWAATGPCIENARILIEAGADPRAEGASETPMHLAARENRFDMLYAMLEAGADPRPARADDYTVAQAILDTNVDPKSEGERWRQKCIALMVSKGIDFERERQKTAERQRRSEQRATRLGEVWIGPLPSCTGTLFGAPGPAFEASDFFVDPKVAEVAEAAAKGDTDRIESLIAQGVRVNAKGEEGLTLLIYAMSGKSTKGFRLLLDRGADPNQQMDQGESALHWAAGLEDSERLTILLTRRGNPNLRCKQEGRPTPLFWAVMGRNVDGISALVKAGADVTARNSMEETPVACAARLGECEMVYTMLKGLARPGVERGLGSSVVERVFDSPVDPVDGAAWREKCIRLFEEKGVEVAAERRKEATLVQRIDELARHIIAEMRP